MRILGLSAFYHDSAAALVEDGRIVAAAQEERFTRKKHNAGFPGNAIEFCLARAGGSMSDVDFVAFYDKPFLKFERLLETYVAFAPKGFQSFKMAVPVWLREKLFQKNLLRRELSALEAGFDWKNKLLFTEHHQSHARLRLLPFALSRCRGADLGWGRRMGDHIGGAGLRQPARGDQGTPFPPFPRAPLFRLHLFHRASESIPANTRSWGWPPMGRPHTRT